MSESKIKKKDEQCNNIAKMFSECDEATKDHICAYVSGVLGVLNMKGFKNQDVREDKGKLVT